MVHEPEPVVVLDSLGLPEGPRWRDGHVVFADMLAQQVVQTDLHGSREVLATLDDRPSGLGWLPDGTLVAVLMTSRKLVSIGRGGQVEVLVDLSDQTPHRINDMVIDSVGHAYVGVNPYKTDDRPTTEWLADVERIGLFVVDFTVSPPAVHVDPHPLRFANGMVVTEDGTLLVAETGESSISQFDIGADGSLSNRRVWAALPYRPDGICLDAEDHVWVAVPMGQPGCYRFDREGKQVAFYESLDGGSAYACLLAGPTRSDLVLMEAPTPPADPASRRGVVRVVPAQVPGAGIP
jgi:sugar lactone lactonase YvrE